jgi:hypothetical protein
MSAPWYEILALVGTNIFFLPYIFLALINGRKYLPQAVIAFMAFCCSTNYHLAQEGVIQYESFEYLQNADHISQTQFLFSNIFLWLQFVPEVQYVFQFIVLLFSLNFTAHLVVGIYSFYAAILTVIFGFLFRVFFYKGHGRLYGFTFVFLAFILASCALVFFFFNDGVGEGNYWWAHGYVWHISILVAATLLLAGEIYHTEITKRWFESNKKIK